MASQAILIVDDEWDVGEIVVFLLAGYGYQTQYVSNASAALGALAHAPADLVLTDLIMPGVDGSELVRKMRAMDKFASTPVLMMSEVPEDIVRRKCPLFTAFLRKPFTSAQLIDAVRKTLV